MEMIIGIIAWIIILGISPALDALTRLDQWLGERKGVVYTADGIVKPNAEGKYIRTVVIGVHNKSDGSTREIIKFGVLNNGTRVSPEEIQNYPQMHLPGLKSATRTVYPINHPDGDWRSD